MNLLNRIAKIALLAWALILQSQAWAGTITYYHNDLTGSPVAATNEAGQVLWREVYRPYGERLTNSPAAIDSDVWFTSRRQDETGLVYMGARYYDPVIGRFVSMDPRGFDAGNLHSHNRYSYANNNPYRYVDPDGHLSVPVAEGVIVLGLIGTAMYIASPDFRRGTDAAIRGLYNTLNTSNDESKPGSDEGKKGQSPQTPESAPNPRDFEDPSKIPEGWEWRGKDKGAPGTREGAYHNPDTGESMHDDRTHPSGKDPHWTYTDPEGSRWDNFGDGWKPQ